MTEEIKEIEKKLSEINNDLVKSVIEYEKKVGYLHSSIYYKVKNLMEKIESARDCAANY